MRHNTPSAPRPGAVRRVRRPVALRIWLTAAVLVAAACAAPPAEEQAAAAAASAPAAAAPAPVTPVSSHAVGVTDTMMTVYKRADCGCCGKWVEHIEQHGFHVDARNVEDVWPIKEQLGVPERLGSCHTAVIAGYVVEGHVPADIIRKMLRERPQIAGIAVAGMPIGSPGMEGDGSRRDRYDVIAIGRDGSTSVYATR